MADPKQAMSQRACLIPTIARSLARIDSANSMSISLKDKMKRLSPIAQGTSSSLPSDKWPIVRYDAAENNLAIAGRLWVISQRSLLDKPVVSIQACINPSHSDHPVSDDMLAEEEPLWYYSRRTTPVQDDRPRELSNEVLPPAGYAQTNQQHGRSIGSPHLDIDVRDSEDDLLLDSYPQNTMENTFCSADKHFHTPDSLDDDLLLTLHIPNQQSVIAESYHCLSTLQTAGLSLDNSSIANPENPNQPLFENDVERTEEFVLNP